MLEKLYSKRKAQLLLGFLIGIGFGFLLDRGGTTDFNIIVEQLLLENFRVVKVIFSAVVVGMIGVHFVVKYLPPELQPKPLKWKPLIVGSLLFGSGFAILGLCPCNAAGAMGTGAVHALFGVLGMILGSGLFASIYPRIKGFMSESDLGAVTVPDSLGVRSGWVVIVFSIVLLGVMYFLETIGY